MGLWYAHFSYGISIRSGLRATQAIVKVVSEDMSTSGSAVPPVVPLDTIYQPRYTVVEESHHSGVFNRTSRTWSHEFHKSVHVQYCQSPVLSVTYGLGFALVIVFPNSLDDFVDVRRRDFPLLLLFLLFLVSTPPVPAFWIRRYPWVFLFERA